jgi:hypothetical protein
LVFVESYRLQRYIVGLALAMAAIAAAAQVEVEQQGNSPSAKQAQELPPGVTTEQHPLKRAFLAKGSAESALFRPNANMPEIVNEDLLREMSDSGKAPSKVVQFAGYMPKIKVLPCATGCEGKDWCHSAKNQASASRAKRMRWHAISVHVWPSNLRSRWASARPASHTGTRKAMPIR